MPNYLNSMDATIYNFLDTLVRDYNEIFSAHDIQKFLNSFHLKASLQELSEFFDNDERVFPLERKLYITRSGAFSGQLFSFAPTRQEIMQKCFVPGDRCIPFADPEILSVSLRFFYKNKLLPKKVFECDRNSAYEFFTLYGDEYSSQYIASDPQNSNLHFAEKDFELPAHLKLTGTSLEPIFEDMDFQYGDRLLLRVLNWGEGVVEIVPQSRNRMNPFKIDSADIERERWYGLLETYLLESFERIGPCSSIEEQLADVFYEHRKDLCVPSCGSIHEFLNRTKKVGIELFGVESRLWFAGESVPAIGDWNGNSFGLGGNGTLPFFSMPIYVIDSFLKDLLHEKKNDISEAIQRMLPDRTLLSNSEREFLALQIRHRNAIIRKKYNWFADFTNAALRHRALDLYCKVDSLVSELDCNKKEIAQLPQQELVTLSQLFTHVSRILEVIESNNDCDEDESYTMSLSLEGMELNFDEIRVPLLSAMDKIRRDRFIVV